eukprot:COSAG05_NODE_18093_length_314_cov_0.679070_1_plen_66_part_10
MSLSHQLSLSEVGHDTNSGATALLSKDRGQVNCLRVRVEGRPHFPAHRNACHDPLHLRRAGTRDSS